MERREMVVRMSALVAVVVALFHLACGQALYSQNLGAARKVRTGMTPEETARIMGVPADRISWWGVEEWRYCSTEPGVDRVVVVYFHGGRVVEKASYTLNAVIQWSDGAPDTRIGESCVDNLQNIYSDGREPPRGVKELRARAAGG